MTGNFAIQEVGGGGGGADVPTMGQYGLIALTTILLGFALFFMRRKN